MAQRQSGGALQVYLVKDVETEDKELGPWTPYLLHLHSQRILPYVNLILLFLQSAFQEEPSVLVGVSQTLIILAISPAVPYSLDYLLLPNPLIDGNLRDPLHHPF